MYVVKPGWPASYFGGKLPIKLNCHLKFCNISSIDKLTLLRASQACTGQAWAAVDWDLLSHPRIKRKDLRGLRTTGQEGSQMPNIALKACFTLYKVIGYLKPHLNSFVQLRKIILITLLESSSNWSLETSALALERTVTQVQLVFQ